VINTTTISRIRQSVLLKRFVSGSCSLSLLKHEQSVERTCCLIAIYNEATEYVCLRDFGLKIVGHGDPDNNLESHGTSATIIGWRFVIWFSFYTRETFIYYSMVQKTSLINARYWTVTILRGVCSTSVHCVHYNTSYSVTEVFIRLNTPKYAIEEYLQYKLLYSLTLT
jgi:hypothetical protein